MLGDKIGQIENVRSCDLDLELVLGITNQHQLGDTHIAQHQLSDSDMEPRSTPTGVDPPKSTPTGVEPRFFGFVVRRLTNSANENFTRSAPRPHRTPPARDAKTKYEPVEPQSLLFPFHLTLL